MRSLIILLLAHSAIARYLFLSMAKSLYIPGERYSLLNITHNFDSDGQRFDISIQFNLTQTVAFNQSNAVFDFMSADESQYGQFINCYNQSIQYINKMYNQYKPCEEICTFTDIESFQENNTLSSLSLNVGDNQNPNAQKSMIIDNTFYPCADGAYQPQLYLWETINIVIQQNQTYQLILKIVCVSLLQLMLILISYLLIMCSKYKKLKGQLQKIRTEKQAEEILNGFINDTQ